jgi:hypothetical protein
MPRDKFLIILQQQSQKTFDKSVWQPQALNLIKWL